MDRVEKARLQLDSVRILRTLKRTRTYEELADETGLPAGDCNRYVNGHVLPGVERARRLVDEIGRTEVAAEVEARLAVDDEGYIDTTGVVFDQPLLELVAAVVADDFESPDVVLTAATDGITLGAATAARFDARVAYAKKSKETAVEAFVEARKRLDSGIELTYYLPAGAVDDGDRVLVVDDLVRSGETQELLLDIAADAGGEVVGVFTLVAVGTEGIERARAATDAPVDRLVDRDP